MATIFLKISSNGNKIFKSKLMTAPSSMIIFNFLFPFSIDLQIKLTIIPACIGTLMPKEVLKNPKMNMKLLKRIMVFLEVEFYEEFVNPYYENYVEIWQDLFDLPIMEQVTDRNVKIKTIQENLSI